MSTRAPRRRRARTISAALALVAAGVLAATTGPDTEVSPALPIATATLGGGDVATAAPVERASPPAGPTFFFDDARDALDDRTAERAATGSGFAAGTPSPSANGPVIASPLAATSIDTDASRRAGADFPAVERRSAIVAPAASSTDDGDALRRAGARDSGTGERLVDSSPPGSTSTQVAVGPGDTLSGILNDHGVRIEEMPALLADEDVVRYLSRLSIGQIFTITQGVAGDFQALATRADRNTRVEVQRAAGGFDVAAFDLPVEKERVVTSGTIEQSLYLAAEKADLKQSTIMTLADIFQWELDFARDIRKGDHFAIVYDRLYREGRYIGDGDILAAEFERGGRVHQAIRFVAEDGTAGYYSPDGTSKRRTFSRHPVDVVRITSKFDPNRLHPVLHQIRAHRGVDYGSPHGSPIRATADGIVRFSGVRGAYGNAVVLSHGERVETLYAHMSRISDKSVVGRRVNQGDVIGYVGNTGRVTGTHLHYEFRVNDVHVDPLTVELPAAAPIASAHRDDLRAVSDELIAQMRSVLPDANLADGSGSVPGAGPGQGHGPGTDGTPLDALAGNATGGRTAVPVGR